jgi:hypothetical protein
METMTRQEELQSIFWDMYKDAYGFRPRGIDTTTWTEADFTEQFERMSQHIDREAALREQREFKAAHAFEMRVQSIIACGAQDRAMALRWIHEAEGTNGDDDYLCWTVGLPYHYFRKVAV